jgi:hypothetical protein
MLNGGRTPHIITGRWTCVPLGLVKSTTSSSTTLVNLPLHIISNIRWSKGIMTHHGESSWGYNTVGVSHDLDQRN